LENKSFNVPINNILTQGTFEDQQGALAEKQSILKKESGALEEKQGVLKVKEAERLEENKSVRDEQ
jgi:hypothetical protein